MKLSIGTVYSKWPVVTCVNTHDQSVLGPLLSRPTIIQLSSHMSIPGMWLLFQVLYPKSCISHLSHVFSISKALYLLFLKPCISCIISPVFPISKVLYSCIQSPVSFFCIREIYLFVKKCIVFECQLRSHIFIYIKSVSCF